MIEKQIVFESMILHVRLNCSYSLERASRCVIAAPKLKGMKSDLVKIL